MSFMYSTEKMRQYRYMLHRERVATAQPTVDCKPPNVNIGRFLQFASIKHDMSRLFSLFKENSAQMGSINGMKWRGKVKTFLPQDVPVQRPIHLKSRLDELDRIDYENIRLGERLLCAKSQLSTWRKEDKEERDLRLQQRMSFTFPEQILRKYGRIKVPESIPMQRKLLRPEIYFDLEIKRVRPLGRFVFQLYTEAAPQVVMELMRQCAANQKGKIRMIRVFPKLWLEGELPLSDDNMMIHNRLEYDRRALDHRSSIGIMSFSARYINGFRHGILSFAISFRPLPALNESRVAFGRITQGRRTLASISEYGSKIGTPICQIIVKEVGIL